MLQKITQFFAEAPTQNFAAKEILLRADDELESFFYLESGCVKMCTTHAKGENTTLHIFYPGACFSLLSLITEKKNIYDFVAMNDVVVRRIPYQTFVDFLQNNADVSFYFLTRTVAGLQGLLHRLEQTFSLSAYQQVASLLLYFAKHSENSTTIAVRLTHQDIAEWLGLTRENVSLQIKKLEREGLIAKSDGSFFQIVDVKKLRQIAADQAIEDL